MPTTIKLRNSVTTTSAPSSLVQGEVAINITDKKVWVGNAATTPIQLLGAGASGTFGALTCTSLTNSGLTSGRVTYASTGGLLADSANFTFNGTTVTMANDASISGLTVGKGGGAVSTNTAVGNNALGANTTGVSNVGVGQNALGSNTTASYSTAVGLNALLTSTTGASNSAFGNQALLFNTTGSQNSAFGSTDLATGSVLQSNTTGSFNNAFGNGALRANTTGNNNSAFGFQSLNANTTASNNTAVGYQAGYSNTTGTQLTAVGTSAAAANTTGNANTAIGLQSLSANTTGSDNTSVGMNSMLLNTTGGQNTAIGRQALNSNTTASNNTAVGYQAGYSNTTGGESVFIGRRAGYTGNGSYNTFVGSDAGRLSTGTNNTFVGVSNGSTGACGEAMTTGSKNTIIGGYTGNQDGLDIRTASNYIVLSDGDGNPRGIFDGSGNFLINCTNTNETTSIGIRAEATGAFSVTRSESTNAASTLDVYSTGAGAYRFYVNMAGTVFATSTTITAISDQRLKENIRDLDTGLDAIMAVKPRKFDWKQGKGADKKDDVGFIAQEFEQVFPNSVTTSKAGEDGIEYKTVNHGELIPTLVKAIQELKAEVDSLKAQLNK